MSVVPETPDPRGGIPLSEHDLTHVRVLPREEWLSRPNNTLPGAGTPGSMRTLYRALTATNCRTSFVLVPMGQTAPRHNSKNQHVITVIRGALEFVLDDARYKVGELEQIFIPIGSFYEYRNVALEDSWFLNMICPMHDWPSETARGQPSGAYEPVQ